MTTEPSIAGNTLDLPLDRKAELLRWLTEEGRFAPDTGGLLEMLCEKLTVLGVPIAPRHKDKTVAQAPPLPDLQARSGRA